MAHELKSVKLISAGLHETPDGTIVLRGVIDSASLKNLKVDDYQREALPLASLSSLADAVMGGGTLPNIEVGMRGSRTRGGEDGTWFLLDDCYIIDGQQRVNACNAVMIQKPGLNVSLGATVHLNTDYDWERKRFRTLNSTQKKVSPNVLLRNACRDHAAVQLLYSYTDISNTAFALNGKISWGQKMKRTELMTAFNFFKAVTRLHTHIVPGRSNSVNEIGHQLDRLVDKVSPAVVRSNVNTFFEVIDDAWGIRNVQYRELCPQLRGTFLFTLARVFSNHTDFWTNAAGSRLFVDKDSRRKLAGFRLTDPSIANLAGSTGGAWVLLYDYLVRHINSGKRPENRLRVRESADLADPTDTGGDGDDDMESALSAALGR